MFKSSASYAHARLRAVFGAGNRNKNKTGVVAMPAAIPSVPFARAVTSVNVSQCTITFCVSITFLFFLHLNHQFFLDPHLEIIRAVGNQTDETAARAFGCLCHQFLQFEFAGLLCLEG